MKKHIRQFLLNGLKVCGGGPVVLAIVYSILFATGAVDTISVKKMAFEIISVTVLAFIAGGVNVVYGIERLPLVAAVLIHASLLYLDYILIYLVNGWLKSQAVPLTIFTVCFAVGFSAVWLIIYLTSKRSTDKVNRELRFAQKEHLSE